MLFIYTTADDVPYAAEDGTFLVVGTGSTELLDLITDRTGADVEAVRELAAAIKAGTATEEQISQYANELQKGAYTYRDMNRVEEAVAFISERLKEAGYLSPIPYTVRWEVTDTPNTDDFARYLSNVKILRDVIAVWDTTPEVPSGIEGFDFNKANELEQILVDIDQALTHMADAWFYSGDLYSAEV
jgi:hypothetical protein